MIGDYVVFYIKTVSFFHQIYSISESNKDIKLEKIQYILREEVSYSEVRPQI